ncbi:unnamed protein product [Prorocentrum cordatum]|uniref:Ubiquitin-like domain-containing protein n=1 Tax=Prorocentrum cordatum TaxID=2364126 RepID=A0ABN9U587_9DINO|nr:unnamed protein product [Polarella glacialis]
MPLSERRMIRLNTSVAKHHHRHLGTQLQQITITVLRDANLTYIKDGCLLSLDLQGVLMSDFSFNVAFAWITKATAADMIEQGLQYDIDHDNNVQLTFPQGTKAAAPRGTVARGGGQRVAAGSSGQRHPTGTSEKGPAGGGEPRAAGPRVTSGATAGRGSQKRPGWSRGGVLRGPLCPVPRVIPLRLAPSGVVGPEVLGAPLEAHARRTVWVEISVNDTIEMLKRYVSRKIGVPVPEMVLIYQGEALKDHSKVKECKLEDVMHKAEKNEEITKDERTIHLIDLKDTPAVIKEPTPAAAAA